MEAAGPACVTGTTTGDRCIPVRARVHVQLEGRERQAWAFQEIRSTTAKTPRGPSQEVLQKELELWKQRVSKWSRHRTSSIHFLFGIVIHRPSLSPLAPPVLCGPRRRRRRRKRRRISNTLSARAASAAFACLNSKQNQHSKCAVSSTFAFGLALAELFFGTTLAFLALPLRRTGLSGSEATQESANTQQSDHQHRSRHPGRRLGLCRRPRSGPCRRRRPPQSTGPNRPKTQGPCPRRRRHRAFAAYADSLL